MARRRAINIKVEVEVFNYSEQARQELDWIRHNPWAKKWVRVEALRRARAAIQQALKHYAMADK